MFFPTSPINSTIVCEMGEGGVSDNGMNMYVRVGLPATGDDSLLPLLNHRF